MKKVLKNANIIFTVKHKCYPACSGSFQGPTEKKIRKEKITLMLKYDAINY